MFISSARIWSVVVMTRELAWKPRCASIRLTNSRAMSTLLFSSWPARTEPAPAALAVVAIASSELGDSTNIVSPLRTRPPSLLNMLIRSVSSVRFWPLL